MRPRFRNFRKIGAQFLLEDDRAYNPRRRKAGSHSVPLWIAPQKTVSPAGTAGQQPRKLPRRCRYAGLSFPDGSWGSQENADIQAVKEYVCRNIDRLPAHVYTFTTDIFGNPIFDLSEWEECCDSVYWDYFLVPREKLAKFLFLRTVTRPSIFRTDDRAEFGDHPRGPFQNIHFRACTIRIRKEGDLPPLFALGS